MIEQPQPTSQSISRTKELPLSPLSKVSRRMVNTGIACGCWACNCGPADALATITKPPLELVNRYDLPRDKFKDAGFAKGMATGMVSYEKAVAPVKKELFNRLFDSIPKTPDVVVLELGMGSFPNAPFYAASQTRLDVVGVDPNDSMESFAKKAAAPLISEGSSVRVVHGVGEALPFADDSVDAVVSTLTLCSVPSPERTLAEVQRVLKPGGQFLFLEHVRSETDSILAAQQDVLNPMQVANADGCNLNRRTLETIRAAGFPKLDAKYFELQGFSYLNPTVAGIATA